MGLMDFLKEDNLRILSLFLMLCFHSVTINLYDLIIKKNQIIVSAFTE